MTAHKGAQLGAQVQNVSYRAASRDRDFAQSLRETGFGVLRDHPISGQLIREVFDDWAKFFNSEEKHRYTFDPKVQSGYFPFKTENAKNSSRKDLKEFFHLYPWSELPSNVAHRTRDLAEQMTALAQELLEWLERYTPDTIRSQLSMPLGQMTQESPENLLRIIHYPPIAANEDPAAIRAAAHEDINLITLLPAATAPGLEVMDSLGRWHPISCDPGQLAINAGDMLQMATQGHYRSTTHQVVNPPGPAAREPRFSMPLFLHPKPDVRLSSTHTAKSFLQERLREIGLLK
jgi:isopenicillin N synthase-like dioxygenase